MLFIITITLAVGATIETINSIPSTICGVALNTTSRDLEEK
jgi:hypothetical protein